MLRWSVEDRGNLSPCWIWQGAVQTRGYGTVGGGSSKKLAHRHVRELLVGPIPDGLELDHLCRQPLCVRPSHTDPVTHRENVARGDSPSAIAARAGTCTRGHVDDFCRRPNGRVVYCRACRRERRAAR